MKTIVAAILFAVLCRPVSAQMYAGTVLFYEFTGSDITIAADSRTIRPDTHEHIDSECKISAFGPRFVFAITGFARQTTVSNSGEQSTKWTAQSLARAAWQRERAEQSAPVLIAAVSIRWAKSMENEFNDPSLIRSIRKSFTDEPLLAGGIFAATDSTGALALRAVSILVDLQLFDATGSVRLWHEAQDSSPDGGWGSGGYDDVVNEFRKQTSTRSKESMAVFHESTKSMSPEEQRAKEAEKLVQLSIDLLPQRDLLGGSIDVAQLRRRTGIQWIHLKPNCPKE